MRCVTPKARCMGLACYLSCGVLTGFAYPCTKTHRCCARVGVDWPETIVSEAILWFWKRFRRHILRRSKGRADMVTRFGPEALWTRPRSALPLYRPNSPPTDVQDAGVRQRLLTLPILLEHLHLVVPGDDDDRGCTGTSTYMSMVLIWAWSL